MNVQLPGLPAAPQVIIGRDKTIHVAALELALPLEAVYAGVDVS